MSYVLYGSYTSPFVRRLRMQMENLDYTFKELKIYEGDGHALSQINPVNQIPVLKDGDTTIWDSRVIFNYLNNKHRFQKMDIDSENVLTAIDGALNAAVALMMLRKSGIELKDSYMIVKRHKDRIEDVFNYLSPYVVSTAQSTWNFHTMSLYSFLDWGMFREIIDIRERPEFLQFLESHRNRKIVQDTVIKV